MSRAFPRGCGGGWHAKLHLSASSRSCALEIARESSRFVFALPDGRLLFSVAAGEWADNSRHRFCGVRSPRARGTEDRALPDDASSPREAVPALLAALRQWNRQPPTDV